MVRFTRNTIIAFDFKDALSFEGETGPYCQYAVVRIRGIFRKGTESAASKDSETKVAISGFVLRPEHMAAIPAMLAAAEGDGIWELLLLAGSLNSRVEAALKAQEPAFVAKYCFELSQTFNNFYHKHHILSEADSARKAFLLSLCLLIERQLVAALKLLGIEAPERM